MDKHRDLRVVIDKELKFHCHIRALQRLVNSLLRSTVNRRSDFMITLFASHIRLILDYCSCIWNVDFVGDLALLEGVQRRWTKQVNEFYDLYYGERLKKLNSFSIRGRLLRADLTK